MADIADAAGVTKPVVYTHFASKHALFRELVCTVADALVDAVRVGTEFAKSPREQVTAGLAAYLRFAADHYESYSLLFGDGAQGAPEVRGAVERVERVDDAIISLVAPAIDVDLDPRHRLLVANGIVGMLDHAARWWVTTGAKGSAEAAAERLADLVWGGLRSVRR